MMGLKGWIVGVGVVCEVLAAGAVCHSPLCPQHLVQCLGAQKHSQKEGKEEERGGDALVPLPVWDGQDTRHPASPMEQLASVLQA